MGDPEWPKTAYAQGGKYAYEDDQETPNTLLASYDYGGREIMFEVRGLLTGGEGFPVPRRPGPPAAGAVAPPVSGATSTAPQHRAAVEHLIGNLFYGTEGWAAMTDQGFQAFRGESNELVMEERPEGDASAVGTSLHMQNFLAACRSRNYKDLHDEIGNAYLSASMCHLANISYRTGIADSHPRPEIRQRSRGNKLLTRDLSQAVRSVTPCLVVGQASRPALWSFRSFTAACSTPPLPPRPSPAPSRSDCKSR